jgi:hypothetical protein
VAQPPPLRTRFPRGCRVVLAHAAVGLDSTQPLEGTVVGYARVGERLWIHLDGRSPKSRSCYHVHGLRRLPPAPLDDESWYAPHTNPYRAEGP